jgi:curved DNA-binding protein CbpA
MPDFFALLSEPRRPWLDVESLKSKFLALSAEVHPDRFHNSSETEKAAANQRYTALNAAYNCLREPRHRIRHLLELELGAKPSDLTNVPEDLMELFFAVGKVFRDVDAFLAKKTAATSPMVQVQLFEQNMERVEELNALAGRIAPRRDALLAELKSLDAVWPSGAKAQMDQLLNIWRLLSFYERWLAQINERAAQLSI